MNSLFPELVGVNAGFQINQIRRILRSSFKILRSIRHFVINRNIGSRCLFFVIEPARRNYELAISLTVIWRKV